MKKLLLAAMAAATLTVGAVADNNGLYLGAGSGKSTLNFIKVDGFDYSENSTPKKVIGGYKLSNTLAMEFHYVDFGSVSASKPQANFKSEKDVR